MRKTILIMALAVATTASAQLVNVKSVERIQIPENTEMKVAGLSPDGSCLLLTTQTNKGLQKYDLATGTTEVLSTEEGAGYNPQISADNKQVVYRETSIDKRNLRRATLVQRSLMTADRKVLLKGSRDLNGFTMRGNTLMTVNRKKLAVRPMTAEKAVEAPMVSISNMQLMLTENGNTRMLSPNGTDKSYIWPSISPDGRHICYYVAGNGCYVCDLNGQNVQYIARDCRAAKWLDNNTLVAMADQDNGEVLTASAIVVYNLQGQMQTLTPATMMAMYPYASADGKHIVCSTAQGEAYMISLE